MNEWIYWGGGDRPVDIDVVVTVMLRSRKVISGDAGVFQWLRDGSESDIVCYLLGKPTV